MEPLTFKNGDQMPLFGLGTWKSSPMEVYEAVLTAIKAGYRHIDCAHIYKNEKEIGEALSKAFKDGWVKREEMWITSKLWNDSHEKQEVLPSLKNTLKHLQLDYLDLYLVHWPVAIKKGIDYPTRKEEFLNDQEAPINSAWEVLEETVEMGLVKHLGVSNFNKRRLRELLNSARIKPEMNQVEMHPFLPQHGLLSYCNENNILVTAYAPLGSAYRVANNEVDYPILLENETIKRISEKHHASPAQVVLSWGMNRGTAVIPKSVNEKRIRENLEATELKLDIEDMREINKLEGPYRYTTGVLWTMEGSPYKQKDLWDS